MLNMKAELCADYAMGGRPTAVVRIAGVFLAIYQDTGESITGLTHTRLEDAAAFAARAALPAADDEDDVQCDVGF